MISVTPYESHSITEKKKEREIKWKERRNKIIEIKEIKERRENNPFR